MSDEKTLIVEDDAALRGIFDYELSESGFQVLTAANGEQALQVLASNSVDVLVVDINLGGDINGIAVLKQCRLDNPDAKIIVITGAVDIQTSAAHGSSFPDVDTILFKPFDYGTLTETVKKMIANA